jgi:hypothetical protein
MEGIYKSWKDGNITATIANARLSAIDDKGLVFVNPIVGGYFQDPVNLDIIRTHDDKVSTLLLGNAILTSKTIVEMIKNVEITDPYRLPPNNMIEVQGRLPAEPDKGEFVNTYRSHLRNPMTNKEFTDGELEMIYDHTLGKIEFKGDPYGLGSFQHEPLDYLRPRPGGGGGGGGGGAAAGGGGAAGAAGAAGGQGGGGKKKRKTKRRKSIKRSKNRKRSKKLKKTKRRKTRRK